METSVLLSFSATSHSIVVSESENLIALPRRLRTTCSRRGALTASICSQSSSFDYCFVGDQGEVSCHKEFAAAGEGAAKFAVIRDSRNKAVFAHVVPSKSVDEKGFAVDALVGRSMAGLQPDQFED